MDSPVEKRLSKQPPLSHRARGCQTRQAPALPRQGLQGIERVEQHRHCVDGAARLQQMLANSSLDANAVTARAQVVMQAFNGLGGGATYGTANAVGAARSGGDVIREI
ncbi:hypothetical protein J8G26_14540 [Acidovorax sp. JG5]|uniref:hypothetical protein n=1 Tax=Acidovorax sp. JG5 TaxID=2822718 RepID=UPI001B32EB73|nr:hypothetical protein [Acidovorax sp. JG5]MBP3981944.1 hypothetical protein [Acidovorax sp. JG5]